MAGLKNEVRLSEKLMLTLDEAARLSGISIDLLRLEVQKGNIDHIKVGKKKLLLNRRSLEMRVDEMSRMNKVLSPSSARQEYHEIKNAPCGNRTLRAKSPERTAI